MPRYRPLLIVFLHLMRGFLMMLITGDLFIKHAGLPLTFTLFIQTLVNELACLHARKLDLLEIVFKPGNVFFLSLTR